LTLQVAPLQLNFPVDRRKGVILDGRQVRWIERGLRPLA
jgi:hypothetical protein